MKMKFKVSVLSMTILFMFSCNNTVVYDVFCSVDKSGWKWNEKCEFPIELNDTTHLHNIYIQLRHTIDYPMRNLYIFVNVNGPSGQILKDTVNVILAEPEGKWTGRGIGKLKELRLLYRKNTIFKDPGTYMFIIEQGMRNPSLPVTDIGIRIEKIL